MFFSDELNGLESWRNVFCSIKAFTPLIYEILMSEQLIVQGKIESLTPGTNAVFKIDNMVIKIFAPFETGFDTECDYNAELYSMQLANMKFISVPKIIAFGEIRDKYLFRYIIMEFKNNEIGINDILSSSIEEKQHFVQKVKDILKKLNKPVDSPIKSITSKNKDEQLEIMTGLNSKLIEELIACSSQVILDNLVLVHGDITRDNILVSKTNDITLIDFADCIQAPSFYEFPAIIFELFLCDRELVSCFVGNRNKDVFLDLLLKGLSIHTCCGYILKDYFVRIHLPLDKIDSIVNLKDLLKKDLFRV
jgi:serine/threonine protein kinase